MAPQQKLVLTVGVLAVLLLAGVVAVLRTSGRPDPSSTPTTERPVDTPDSPRPEPTAVSDDLALPQEPARRPGAATAPAALEPPVLKYAYQRVAELPVLQTSAVPVDVFIAADEDYARRLAELHGFPKQQPFIDGDRYIFQSDLTVPGGALLHVNAHSGYSSYTVVYPGRALGLVRSPADAVRAAEQHLRRMGQLPAKLDPPVTYSRRSTPGITYVEFHRPWDPLPILETTGMLRADLDDRTANRPPDPEVLATSDRTDGLARPADFNTITVAVDRQARVLAADVRMRPVARTLAARPLKAPQQAWDELAAGKGILGFTLPSQSNITGKEWDEIFPGGVASSDEAQVRNIILAYVEKPDGTRQEYLQPVYIFKGTAKLATGPLADFLVAVPALADDSLPTT